MVVNFRGKDINAAGVRVSGTKITATPDEINQVCDGVGPTATAANVTALTDVKDDLLAAASGGGSVVLLHEPAHVTSTELKNVTDTVTATLVPGVPGSIISLFRLVARANNTATPYTVEPEGSPGLAVGYSDAAAGASLVSLDPVLFVDQTVARAAALVGDDGQPADLTSYVGASLVLRNLGSPLLGGTGTADLDIWYTLVTP